MGTARVPPQTHFVGLLVPEDLALTISDCRAWMRQRYGCRSGHGTAPHITLVPPFALPQEYGGHDVLRAVEDAAGNCARAGILPFTVHVSGFGAFTERTLFAHVEDAPEWQEVRSALYGALARALPGTLRKVTKPFTPHLTVANRDIPPGAMDAALRHFAGYALDEAFSTDRIAVFTRSPHGGWEIGAEVSP